MEIFNIKNLLPCLTCICIYTYLNLLKPIIFEVQYTYQILLGILIAFLEVPNLNVNQ